MIKQLLGYLQKEFCVRLHSIVLIDWRLELHKFLFCTDAERTPI